MRSIEVPEFIRGLIFDCDGTLVDSMPLHMRAWQHVITGNGGEWNYEFFFSKKGMPETAILGLYNAHYGKTCDPVETVRRKHAYFRSHLEELKPIREVVDVAGRFHGKLPMAVVSGGTRENVCLELEVLGLTELFPVVLTADDAIKPKPAPDLFLEAARRIGIAPDLCQVFEDGDVGLDAARAAGMLPTDVREYIQSLPGA